MTTISILDDKKIVFSQKINKLNINTINAELGDSIILENPESLKIVTRQVGKDLLLFFDNSKNPTIVLQDYFKNADPAIFEMKSGGESFFYQPLSHSWVSEEQFNASLNHELSGSIEPISGGGGAAAGIPPLVWGLGAIATLGGAYFLLDEDEKETSNHQSHHIGDNSSVTNEDEQLDNSPNVDTNKEREKNVPPENSNPKDNEPTTGSDSSEVEEPKEHPEESTPPENSDPKDHQLATDSTIPYLSVNLISEDSFWRQGEAVSLQGEARHVANGESVTVTVGNQSFAASVENGMWHLTVSPEQLATINGGLQDVSVSVNHGGKDIHSSTVSVLVESFESALGELTISPDDAHARLNNLNAWEVSGEAKNIADNSTVIVSLNNQLHYGKVSNGHWQVEVNSDSLRTLKEDETTSYQVFVEEGEGKTVTATGEVTLDVQANGSVHVTEFKEQFNPTAGEDLTISGNVRDLGYSNYSYSFYVAINGKNYAENQYISDNSDWSVTIPAADLAALPAGSQQDVLFVFFDSEGRGIRMNKSFVITNDEIQDLTQPILTFDPIAEDSILSAGEYGQDLHFTGKAENLENHTLELTLNGKTYSPEIVNNMWSLTLPADAVQELQNHHSYIANVVAKGGEHEGLKARAGISVQLDPVFTVDPITGDNILQSSEHQSIGGRAYNVANEAVVLVEFNGKQYSSIVHDGYWSLTLNKEDVQRLNDNKQYSVTVHLGENSASSTLLVDLSNQNTTRNFTTREDTTLEEAIEYWKIISTHDKITAVDTTHVNIPADGSGINNADVKLVDDQVIADNIIALNAFRSFNKLDPLSITPNIQLDTALQKGAIAMAAEGTIRHGLQGFQNTDPDGVIATKNSVLSMQYGLPESKGTITGYIADDFNGFPGAGHRVQMFSPTLGYTTLGAAIHGEQGHGYVFSDMATIYSGLINKNAYIPETIEWPAAGYIPFALMPKKVWTFSTNTIGETEAVDITIVRTAADGSVQTYHLDPSKINRDDHAAQLYEGRYSTVLTFEPFDYTYHYNGLESTVVTRPDGVDVYQVNITAGDKHWHYDVKVFDELSDAYAHARENRAEDISAAPIHLAPTSAEIQIDEHLIADNSPLQLDNSGHNIHFNHLNIDLLNTGDGNDQVVGNSISSQLNLGRGDDHVFIKTLNDGAEISLNYGDDWLLIDNYQGGRVDGGAGYDTLSFNLGGNVTHLEHFTGFEAIDLGQRAEGDLPNILNITLNDLLKNQDDYQQLTITGGEGNKISLVENEVQSITEMTKDGQTYHDICLSNGVTNSHLIVADTLYLNGEGIVIL